MTGMGGDINISHNLQILLVVILNYTKTLSCDKNNRLKPSEQRRLRPFDYSPKVNSCYPFDMNLAHLFFLCLHPQYVLGAFVKKVF